METNGQEGLKNKREQQHLPEEPENPPRKRHKGQPASGEVESAPKRPPNTRLGRRRDYTGRGGRPNPHENLESGAQYEPTGKGTEKTRANERQYPQDGRQETGNSQVAEERPSVGPAWKAAEAARQNHR